MGLTAADLKSALATIACWRADPEAPASCPRCEGLKLALADRSARPYAEWYQLSCPGCGLEETIHIPLAPPVVGGLD